MKPLIAALGFLLVAGCTQEQAQRFADGVRAAQEPQLWPMAPVAYTPPPNPMQFYNPPLYVPPPLQAQPVTTNCTQVGIVLQCQSF